MVGKTNRKGRSIALLAALVLALVAVALIFQAGVADAAPASGGTLIYEADALLEDESATASLRAQGNCCGIVWSGDAQLFFLSKRNPATHSPSPSTSRPAAPTTSPRF
ncbi:MAG: hypothetical protein CYG60_14115 [Actinobacteria bacterium]|nr:hypothetical protein [Actinomycetota bacterium]PLS85142.1 MAG: hypothetical protein CYG60_14115 [Actinomycetota bacterium]